MAVKRTLGKLLLALVAATWLPPQATLAGWHGHRKPVSEHRDLDIARWLVQSKDFLVNLCSGLGSVATTFQAQTLCFQLSGRPLPLATSKVPQPPGKRDLPLSARKVTLSGGTACLERPPAKLRACGLPGDDQGLPKDFMVNLFAATGTVAAAVVAFVQAGIAQRDSERAQRDSERAQREAERAQRDSERAQREAERAQRESKEGRTQAAADRMIEPFTPKKKKAEVVQRGIMKTIEERILHWKQHATIISGRFGAGKTVAVEEALRDMQGVFVHQVDGNDWKEELFKRLGLDGPDMLEEVLRRVRDKLKRPPILLLDIPRTTKQGMDTVSSFAKLLSSDSSLAHVIVCASSAAMAIAFDAGGAERQDNFWVGDLTEDEAEKLLTLHGHMDKTDEFLNACGYNALDLVHTCERYAEVGEEALQAKKAEMEERAYEDVETFLRDCKFKTVDGITPAGANILKALLQNRAGGGTVGRLAGGSGALPKDVAKWIRERDAHAVIWHIQDKKYQFVSELHAKAAARFQQQIDDLSS